MTEEIFISLCTNRHRGVRLSRGWGYRMFYFAVLGLVLLGVLAAYPLPFYNGTVSAGPGNAKLSTTSITLATTATGSSVSLIPGAGFKLSNTSDTAGFNVTTDNFTGYSISLTAADNNQTLVNTNNSSYIINSITSPILETNFIKTNPTLINRWGIKPNKYYDTSSSSTVINTTTILPAPTTAGIMLDVTSAANSTANNYSIALGAMVDGTKPAGTYVRETTLQVTPNPVFYTLNYDKNTTDTVTDFPSAQNGSTTATNIVISSNTPLRNNYTFTGWCLGTTSTTDGVDSCTGTVFHPGDNFGIDQTVANSSTIYAMWVINDYTITYGTVTGIDSVSLDGATCTTALSSGGCTKVLTYNHAYSLIATPSTGYSFTSWNAGTNGTIADTTAASTTYTVGGGTSTITPTATINTYTITYGTVTGIDSVSLDGTACTTALSAGGCTKNLTYNETYNLTVTPSTGYSFTSWNAGASGTIADTTSSGATTTYTVGAGASTITPTATINTYAITYGTVTGIASVTLDGGTACTTALSSGGCTKTLTYNQSYTLTATLSTGYSFTSWSAGTNGTIASTTSASTNYTVGAGASTITPTATINTYKLTVTFAGVGVSSVKVCKTSGNCSGTNLMGTVSSSGGSVSGLAYNTAYYLYPTYSTGYTLSSWSKTSTTGTLSSTSAANPTFTMGAGNGAVTITGKTEYTIQNFTLSLCSSKASSIHYPVTDSRDNQIYTVRYINGNCWMTRNIAIGCNGSATTYGSSVSSKSLSSTYSNVSTTWATPTSLLSNASTADSYTEPRMLCSSTYGAWYNYVAATAGTIKGETNTTDDTYNICPKNWTLPSLAQSQSVEGSPSSSNYAAFSGVSGGCYTGGAPCNTARGYWWISQGGTSKASRYRLRYASPADSEYSTGLNYSTNLLDRTYGFYVRCVRK